MSVSKEEQPKADVNLTNHEEPPNFYPIGPKLILITISLMLAVFCLDLDNTPLLFLASQLSFTRSMTLVGTRRHIC
ncbi:Sucrose symporter plant [Penicillium subrubescens]|uniref:Sucrose symporter plant n=1 Tax=Penicillium subrubescens TaxID=1316194 RepID=UPI002545048A|nr:Sucrose symporter plant [Penicillium subrubescens]KAJ5890320.1 Sucrose symporter plant [Penicillium subrubescens]